MRILVVGAGAIGGYFGGRLLEAGRDVTFLVRPRRAEQLARSGLRIQSPRGDVTVNAPTVQANELTGHYDLIILSCKAYDLEGAIASFAPAVGPSTTILPLLNGMRHIEILEQRFGATSVLGGQCLISATLDAEGRVSHLADTHIVTFGERAGGTSDRIQSIAAAFTGANFDAIASEAILQSMWEKWVFIATGAGITCLMRAAIGDIVAAGASDLSLALLHECAAIAASQGFALSDAAMARNTALVTAAGSPITASMLRDIENGGRTEADHVLGDLLRRTSNAGAASLLRIAYAHVLAYEARRARTIR